MTPDLVRVVQGADGGHDDEVEPLEQERLALLAPQHEEGDEVEVALKHQHEIDGVSGTLCERGDGVLHGGDETAVERGQR